MKAYTSRQYEALFGSGGPEVRLGAFEGKSGCTDAVPLIFLTLILNLLI